MGHRIIIGNDHAYGEHGEGKPEVVAVIDYAPADGLTLDQECDLFRKHMKVYRKALGMNDGGEQT